MTMEKVIRKCRGVGREGIESKPYETRREHAEGKLNILVSGETFNRNRNPYHRL